MHVVLPTAVLIGTLLWYFQSHPIRSSTAYICSRCRATQRVTKHFGIKSSRIEVSDYTVWFTQFHPSHEHHWCWSGTYMEYYVFSIGRACGRQHPVWQIPTDLQREFVESAAPEELDQFYACMDSSALSQQQRGAEMVWNKALGDAR